MVVFFLQSYVPLKPYQTFCKDFIINTPGCGLFLKMGLGKTLITLEALYELNPKGHTLIIAPHAVAKCTWYNEINKWHFPFRFQSLVLNKNLHKMSKKQREKILSAIYTTPPTLFVINTELVISLVNYFQNKKWPFSFVVIDESQSFKSPTAQRFKKLQSVRPEIQRIVILTGSPQPKGIEDLWSQIYLLDEGKRLGKYISHFRNQYCNPGIIVNNHPVDWRPKPGAEEQIYDRIRDIVISMENNQIQLPPITYNDVHITLDADAKQTYKELLRHRIIDSLGGEPIVAKNAGVLHMKLAQMASGAIYTDAKTHAYEVIHEDKLEMCEYIINNSPDNVIIAYHFQSDKDMLLRYLQEHDIPAVVFDGTPQMQDAWNKKQYKVMLLQPSSNGRGLNLQDGGATLIWYTLPWSLEAYEQTIGRIYRQGQTSPCVIHHLIADGTVDVKTMQALRIKDVSQSKLIEAVKAQFEI